MINLETKQINQCPFCKRIKINNFWIPIARIIDDEIRKYILSENINRILKKCSHCKKLK